MYTGGTDDKYEKLKQNPIAKNQIKSHHKSLIPTQLKHTIYKINQPNNSTILNRMQDTQTQDMKKPLQ